jgi:pimeloyl-ACP methyl ester carboxylesterase
MRQFTATDGLTIAYHEWGAGNRDNGRPPVVLHHGFAVDAQLNWVDPGVVDALVRAGRHVVAPDARGHGRSAKPHDPACYGEARMAEDLGTLFDEIGAREVHLVGYSMGAIVALLTAARDQRVNHLVVGGAGAGAVELGGLDTRAVPSEAIVAALTTQDPSRIEHDMERGFRALADATGADRLALAAQAAAIHTGAIDFTAITAPALIIAGADDPLAVRPHVLAGALPDARLQVLPGDHLGAVLDPGFAAAIVAFLDTTPT